MCANTVFAVVATVLVMNIHWDLRRANRKLDAVSDVIEQDVFDGAGEADTDITIASPGVRFRYVT